MLTENQVESLVQAAATYATLRPGLEQHVTAQNEAFHAARERYNSLATPAIVAQLCREWYLLESLLTAARAWDESGRWQDGQRLHEAVKALEDKA